jgi:hypothetical protein
VLNYGKSSTDKSINESYVIVGKKCLSISNVIEIYKKRTIIIIIIK